MFRFATFHGIVRMLQMSVLFLIAAHLSANGVSGLAIGGIFAISQLSSIITILPSGFSNDRFKSKHLITLGLLLESLQYFALAATTDVAILMIFFFFGGLGHTLYKISADSVFYRSKSDAEVARHIAIFNNATYILIAAGIVFASFMLQIDVPFTAVFLTVASLLIFAGLSAQLIVSDQEKSKVELLHYSRDLRRPKVLFALLIIFLFHTQFAINTTSYSPFLAENLGLDKLGTGLFMAAAIVPMAFITYYIAKIKDRVSTTFILPIAILMAGLGNIIVATSNLWISLGGRILNEMGNALFFFFSYFIISKLFERERVGGNASIFALTTALASATGAQLFGPIGDKFGYETSFFVSGCILLTCLLIALKFLPNFKHD